MHISNSRRRFLRSVAALPLAAAVPGFARAADAVVTRAIPSSGEQIPVVGLGTSRTLDVYGEAARKELVPVLQAFFDHGGALIDSSPMYGAAEAVIGELLRATRHPRLFSATKVWIDGRDEGVEQMEASRRLWGVDRLDLIQIHNLRDWEVHIETLKRMKSAGEVRYIGITTSHGRDHEELEAALKKEKFDFVQLTYNIEDRAVERRLLPLAQERGTAVLVNRPFQRGGLFGKVQGRPLPDWAAQIDCQSWGQYFLKYAVSHPAVTCAIPATSKVKHVVDNMGAAYGRMPDAPMRKRMADYVEKL